MGALAMHAKAFVYQPISNPRPYVIIASPAIENTQTANNQTIRHCIVTVKTVSLKSFLKHYICHFKIVF